jgi:signal transduction histidine kinase
MTARLRLTLLYTGLFFAAGLVLIVIVNALVRTTPGTATRVFKNVRDANFLANCKAVLQNGIAQPPNLVDKCRTAFSTAARVGATTQRASTTHDLLLYSIVALAATTMLAAAIGWVVAGRILRPVHAITATAQRASEQHLGERLALRGPKDELRELADTFDEMLDRLDRAFAAQRRFVANASHELRTPLTVMHTAIDVTLAKPAPTAGDYEAMATSVKTSLAEAEDLIEALLTLARSDQRPDRTAAVDLATCCEEALETAANRSDGASRCTIQTELEPAVVAGDSVLLRRMVANIIDNAFRYNTDEGVVEVRTETLDDDAVLTISNTGPIVDAEGIGQLFEPFHRLQGRISNQDGFGLGLSIVRAVAESHGGTVTATARAGGGLVLRVVLPAAAPPPPPGALDNVPERATPTASTT